MKLRLTLTTLVTILFMATACSSEPTPTPSDTEQIATQEKRVNQAEKEINDLQAEVEALTNKVQRLSISQPDYIEQPNSTQNPPDLETDKRQADTIPANEENLQTNQPMTGNICNRTPGVQGGLLRALDTRYCQFITKENLFRIQRLAIGSEQLRPGDLAGLPNLKELSLTLKNPPHEGALANLSNLEKLEVSIIGPDIIWQPSEIFTELGQLRTLNIEAKALAGIPQIKPPFLDIAPAGIPPNIIPHSKGVKCGLMRPDSLKVPAFIGQPLYCQA